jgi:hypothetical protein
VPVNVGLPAAWLRDEQLMPQDPDVFAPAAHREQATRQREPVMRLAERCGLPALAGEHIRLPASKDGTGAFPAAKVMSLVGGMPEAMRVWFGPPWRKQMIFDRNPRVQRLILMRNA